MLPLGTTQVYPSCQNYDSKQLACHSPQRGFSKTEQLQQDLQWLTCWLKHIYQRVNQKHARCLDYILLGLNVKINTSFWLRTTVHLQIILTDKLPDCPSNLHCRMATSQCLLMHREQDYQLATFLDISTQAVSLKIVLSAAIPCHRSWQADICNSPCIPWGCQADNWSGHSHGAIHRCYQKR